MTADDVLLRFFCHLSIYCSEAKKSKGNSQLAYGKRKYFVT